MEAEGRIENLLEFVAQMREYEREAEEPTLHGFLERIALVSDVDGYDPDKGAVSLMTVHTAKGLEFPVVFITGLEERIFPHARSVDDDSAVEEERRLCYVAVTRARTNLYLSRVRRRRLSGQELPGVPSRFLRDLPAGRVEAIVMARPPEYGGSYGDSDGRGPWGGGWSRDEAGAARAAVASCRRAARARPAGAEASGEISRRVRRTTDGGRPAGRREAAAPVVRRGRGARLAGRGRRHEGHDAFPRRGREDDPGAISGAPVRAAAALLRSSCCRRARRVRQASARTRRSVTSRPSASRRASISSRTRARVIGAKRSRRARWARRCAASCGLSRSATRGTNGDEARDRQATRRRQAAPSRQGVRGSRAGPHDADAWRVAASCRSRLPRAVRPVIAACERRSRRRRRSRTSFPPSKVAVEVYAGKRTLAVRDAGVTARELSSGVVVRAQFLPDERAVAVWVRVPQCNGGEPPDYWGKGFPGNCYHETPSSLRR